MKKLVPKIGMGVSVNLLTVLTETTNDIQDLCVPVSTVSTRSALHSAARGDLVVPRTRRRLGNRAFSVAGPAAWNSLPPDIRTASTLRTFKNLLKTHLFFFIRFNYQLNFEKCMLYGTLVVTLWTCYGAL